MSMLGKQDPLAPGYLYGIPVSMQLGIRTKFLTFKMQFSKASTEMHSACKASDEYGVRVRSNITND